jgi:hypothetical protein
VYFLTVSGHVLDQSNSEHRNGKRQLGATWETLQRVITKAAPKGWEFPFKLVVDGELTIGQLWSENKMDETW